MHEHSINVRTPAHAQINGGQLARFLFKGCAYSIYGLFVVVDGANNPESYDSRFLTLPYFVGGLALLRAFCEALDHGYDGHAVLFAFGLSTLGGLS